MIKMNKKGAEQVLSFYWLIMFGIVAIVVVSGVLLFYSKPLDIRGSEDNILINRIAGCFSDNGQLTAISSDVLDGKKSLEEACGFNFEDIPANKGKMQYFIKINVEGKEVKFGDNNFEPLCGQQLGKVNIPLCVEKKFFVLDSAGRFAPVNILVAILKVAQNAVA